MSSPKATDLEIVPEPRARTLMAAAVYAAATLLLGWPALIGKFLVGPHSDQYIAGYAFREFAAQTLRATHSFPLWNPYQFGGMPYVAALHGDIFYPTFLLRMVLPTDVAMTWGFMIHVFFAGLFAYLFLRRIGLSFAGGLVGGLAYMLSGHVATLVSPGHDGKLFVIALFPLLLWLLHALLVDRRLWAVGALALVVGLNVLSPHLQLLQYSLLASGAYALFLAVQVARDTRSSRGVIKRLGMAMGAVALGFLIGAVQFLPVRGYVAWSPRAAGIGTYERATSFAKNPPEVLNAYLPEFGGILEHYWGQNGIHFQGDYTGVAVLILATVGLFGAFGTGVTDESDTPKQPMTKQRLLKDAPRRDGTALRKSSARPSGDFILGQTLISGNERREAWFWAGLVIVSLLWALGAHTPFYRLPFYLVPGTKYFRAPDTAFFVGTFGIAVLAARGVDRALRAGISRRMALAWIAFAGVVALLAATGTLSDIARSMASPSRQDAVDANAGALAVGAFRSLLVAVLTVGVLWKGKVLLRTRSAMAVSLALLVTGDLYAVNRQYWIFSPPANVLYSSSPAIDYLKHLDQPSRVLTLQMLPGGHGADLRGSGLMVHRVLNTFGYHGNEIARYNTLVDIAPGSGPSEESFRAVLENTTIQKITATQFVLTNSRRFLNAMPTATEVAGPATEDSSGNSDYLFRLAETTPFAWLSSVSLKAPDEAVLATLQDPRFDATQAALFAPDAQAITSSAPPAIRPPNPTSLVRITHYAPGHIHLTFDTSPPAGTALVVAENYYPGWIANVDGRTVPVSRVQYSLMGISLPPSARQVDFIFTSPSYELGKHITWGGFALAILLLLTALLRKDASVPDHQA